MLKYIFPSTRSNGNILAGRLIQSIAIHWKRLIDAPALSAARR